MTRPLAVAAALIAAFLVLAGVGRAAPSAVVVDQGIEAVDLTPVVLPLGADQKPPQAQATAGGRWYGVTLHNPSPEAIARIVVFDLGTFGSYGILGPSDPPALLQMVSADEGASIEPLRAGLRPAARVLVPSGETVTLAFEFMGPIEGVTVELWDERALDRFDGTSAVIEGILIGLVLALAGYVGGLIILRREPQLDWCATLLAVSFFSLVVSFGFTGPFDFAGVLSFGTAKLALFVLASASALQFVFVTVDAERRWPRYAGLLRYLPWIAVAIAGLTAFDIPYAPPAARIGIFVCGLVATASVVRAAIDGDIGARKLFWGALLLALALASAAVATFGLAAGRNAMLSTAGFYVAALLIAGFAAASETRAGFRLREIKTGRPEAFATAVAAAPMTPPARPAATAAGRRTEEPKRDDDARFQLALAAAHQGVWDWDLRTDKLYLSPSVEAWLGVRPGSLSGAERNWAGLVHPDDLSTYEGALAEYRAQGDIAFSLEFRVRAADGGYRWLQLRASFMSDGREAARCLGIVTDVTAMKQQEASLIAAAAQDQITGLPNRATFLDALRRGMGRAEGGARNALLVLDLDRFKKVNDALGHAAGDALLAAVAARLQTLTPEGGISARLGGDEFAVVWNEAEPLGALDRAERIIAHLAEPLDLNGQEIFPAASGGLALLEERHQFAEDALRDAEIAMYHAKRHGRGQLAVFAPVMRDSSTDMLAFEADLRRALERREIAVFYQPIVALSDDSVAGFEALLRWRHPTRGLVPAEEFVSLAEETGLILPLGRYVLEIATSQLADWQRFFPLAPPLFISVNVSSRQLLRPDFLKQVEDILVGAALAPGTLKFEVTESLVMENPDAANRVLTRLRKMGAGLAIDDFGVGHSSLQRLGDLPFDTIKIDKSFVLGAAEGREDAATILEKIVRMAHGLSLVTVAEGVESEAALERLRALGCDYAQGYLWGEPGDAAGAHAFIAEHYRLKDVSAAT